MLKNALFKLFISRAAPKVVEYAGKALTKGAAMAAGALAAHGFAAGDNLNLIAAGVTGLVAVGIDFARTHYGDTIAAKLDGDPSTN